MIRAVLFDLDGTLMDSTDAIVDSYFHTFDTIGEPRPDRQFIIKTYRAGATGGDRGGCDTEAAGPIQRWGQSSDA